MRAARGRSGVERLLLWMAVAGVVAFVGVGVGAPLIGHGTFTAGDLLYNQPPWRQGAPTAGQQADQIFGDTIDSVIPQRAAAAERIRNGDYPLWQQYDDGGSLLEATPDSGLLMPLNWPFLFMPAWLAPAWVKVLEVLAAVVGMVLLGRRIGLATSASVVGGLVFAGSGFLVMWTNWPQAQVAAMIPLLFWAVERAVQVARLSAAVPVALVAGSMVLGGFPAVTIWSWAAAVLWVVVRLGAAAVARRRTADPPSPGISRAGPAAIVTGFVLGVALAAFQLLPFGLRLSQLGLESRADINAANLPAAYAVTAAVPDAFGLPSFDSTTLPLNSVESVSFIGVVALILLAFGLATRRTGRLVPGVRWWIVIVGVVCFELIFVGGPPLQLEEHLPLLRGNAIGRLRSLLGFVAALGAALGWHALVRRPEPAAEAGQGRRGPTDREPLRWAVVGFAVLAVAAGVLLERYVAIARPHGGVPLRAFAVPAAFAAAALALILAALRWRRLTGPVAVVLLAMLVTQSALFVRDVWPHTPRDQFYPVTATHRFLDDHLGGDRYAAFGEAMVPGTSLYYGQRSLTGHLFVESRWLDLLRAVEPGVMRSPTYSLFHSGLAPMTSSVLDRLGVRYAVTSPDDAVVGPAHAVPATSTTGPDGTVLLATVPSTPFRAVGVTLDRTVASGRAVVTVRDGNGSLLATGTRSLAPTGAGTFTVGVPAWTGTPPGPLRIEARVSGVAAGAVTPGTLTLVGDQDDGLRLVYAGDTVIYERTRALPRIRWADRAEVVPDGARQVQLLAGGQVAPDTVLLSRPGPPAGAKPATVQVVRDTGDEISVRVAAAGAGYLVVSDPLQSQWGATVDGHATTLRAADHAVVAVAVPAGRHTVVLRADPKGWAAGLAVSGAAGLIIVGLAAAPAAVGLGRRRR